MRAGFVARSPALGSPRPLLDLTVCANCVSKLPGGRDCLGRSFGLCIALGEIDSSLHCLFDFDYERQVDAPPLTGASKLGKGAIDTEDYIDIGDLRLVGHGSILGQSIDSDCV